MNESTAQIFDRVTAETGQSLRSRLKTAWELEFGNFRWRLLTCTLLARLLPERRAVKVRTALVRAIGLHIAPGTRFLGMPKLTSSPGPLGPRLRVGNDCTIGSRIILEFSETITIGDRSTLGDRAMIITTSHQLGPKEHRAGPLVRSPVTIGNDVTIGVNAIILPGVTIGDGARVLADSVVNSNVAAGVTVMGIPARPQRPTPSNVSSSV